MDKIYSNAKKNAIKDLKIFINEKLPLLKTQETFTLAEVYELSEHFFNAGSLVVKFQNHAETTQNKKQKTDANKVSRVLASSYSAVFQAMEDRLEKE